MSVDLRRPNLRKLPIRSQVITSKGFSFILVCRGGKKESWKDSTTGLIWSDTREKRISHNRAVEKYGDKLPTKEQFKTAETHGIREVIDMGGRWFISSSVHPDYADYDCFFNGNNGYIDYGDRSVAFDYSSVVCAGR